MLTLLIGDLFIPDRVVDIPSKFCKLLAPNAPSVPSNAKISQVLCLGNITQSASTLKFLHDLSPFYHAVRGEFDDASIVSQQLALLAPKNDASLPLYKVVTADSFRIGFTSGHQIVPRNDPLSLLAFAREIDVDILVWGGTHRVEAYTLDGKFFISPGSATGAFSMGWPDLDEEDEEGEDEDEDEEELEASNKVPSSGVQVEEKSKTSEGDEKIESENASAHGSVDKTAVSESNEPEFDSAELTSTLPSFCLLDTNSSRCTLFIYTHVNGEVKVDKVLYSKD